MKKIVLIFFTILLLACQSKTKNIISIKDQKSPLINIEQISVYENKIYIIDGKSGFLHIYSKITGEIIKVVKADKKYVDSLASQSYKTNDKLLSIKELKQQFPDFNEEESMNYISFRFHHLCFLSPDSLILLGQGSAFMLKYSDYLKENTYFVTIPTFILKIFNEKKSIELLELKYFSNNNFVLYPQIDILNLQNDTIQVAAISYPKIENTSKYGSPNYNTNYPIIANYDFNGKYLSSKLNDQLILEDKNLNTRMINPLYCSNNTKDIFSAKQLNYFIDINDNKLKEFKNLRTKENYSNQTLNSLQQKIENKEPLVDFQLEDIYLDENDNIYIYYLTVDIIKNKLKNQYISKYDIEGNLLNEQRIINTSNLTIEKIKFNREESNLIIVWRNIDDGTWLVEIKELF